MITIAQFIAKWRRVALTERSAAQQHFLDLCELVGHPKPAEVDPTGDSFTYMFNSYNWKGGVAEFIAYNRALAPEETSLVEATSHGSTLAASTSPTSRSPLSPVRTSWWHDMR